MFLILLFARFVIDLVMAFSRGFRPTGALLLIFEVVFTITDPPMRFLRRFIPPLRLGGVAIDLSFLLLFILTQVAINYAQRL
ncbi:MAG TPA: YggT family protein [Frankiaceae bacterium]|nr:YggT family protein [Frankiaceae bacterium]